MNLWPFSKKTERPLENSSELPPGVILATGEDTELFSPEISFQQEPTPTPPIENVNPSAEAPPLSMVSEPPLASAQPTSSNERLLDLFTPPATPEVSWAPPAPPEAEATIGQLSGQDAQPSLSVENFSTPGVPLEESFALTEASDVTWFEEPGLEITDPADSVLETPLAMTPSVEEANELAPSAMNNVVPFPVRQVESAEAVSQKPVFEESALVAGPDTGLSLEWQPETPTTDFYNAELDGQTVWTPECIDYEQPPIESTAQAGAQDLSPVTLEWESTGEESDTSFYAASPEQVYLTDEPFVESFSGDEMSFSAGEAWSASDSVSEEPCFGEVSALEPLPDALTHDEPEIVLESAVTPLDAYDSILGQVSLEDVESSVEMEASPPKDLDSYDLGYYEDPEAEVEPLLLEEISEPLESIVEEASHVAEMTPPLVESVSPEPPPEPLPSASEPKTEPMTVSVVSEEVKLHRQMGQHSAFTQPVTSATAALNSFSQQVILQESRAVKRSIDDLVAQYFASQHQEQLEKG